MGDQIWGSGANTFRPSPYLRKSAILRALRSRRRKNTRTTPHHSQSNGQTERTNRLKYFTDQAKQDCSDELLPQRLMAYRCTVHKPTGPSPALLMLGRELWLPFDTIIPLYPTMALTHYAFVAQKAVLQHDTFEMTRHHLKPQKDGQTKYCNLLAYGSPCQPGDRVWLHQHQTAGGICSKLHIP